jgi:hypothetical protein
VDDPEGEQVLQGGNTNVVVRVGDTVRRETGHWTPAVHALLKYLELAGFGDAPRVLCLDRQGREVLLFVEGEVGLLGQGHRLPPWFRSADACVAIGDWLRRFHEAQYGFIPDPALPWRMVPGRSLKRGEVVVHHDAAPYNTIQRPFGGLTVIDWDFCRPGDPIEDLAFAAWQWVPLWADKEAVASGHGGACTVQEASARLGALADGYHASIDQRWMLVEAIAAQLTRHADDVEGMAVADPAFARLVDQGVSRNARLDAGWVRENEAVLSAALHGS